MYVLWLAQQNPALPGWYHPYAMNLLQMNHLKRPLKKARREIIQDILSKNPDQNKNNQVWSRKKETEKIKRS